MTDFLWWRDGVIYQIYPRSFLDTNGDGLGDLPGITARLDYLADLGVAAIWLSPFYPSPDKDFGYDVADHCAVDPRYGTLADFDALVQQAHARGIRVVLDLVLNHTSDQHPWFQEARSSRDPSAKRDWYLWRDPRPGRSASSRLPNNWMSMFSGAAWGWEPATGQYYLHLFAPEQPDLNWRNPAVRQAQLDVVRFWLRRDVDGFRLDVFNAYFKDETLRDNPTQFGLAPVLRRKHVYDIDQPEMIPLLNELRGILDGYPERYAVGETSFATVEKAAAYCGPDRLHAAFSFEFTGLAGLGVGWGPRYIARKIQERERVFGAAGVWPTTVMGNHDVPRPATRYCRGEDDAPAKLAMALLLTLRGTPFLYYGDEIGMRDLNLRRDQIMDPVGKAYWPFLKGRDGCRSPMQWDGTPQAGFTTGRPWLRVHGNATQRNLAAQRQDPSSLFNFTRDLIALRKQTPALIRGALAVTPSGSPQVLAFTRTLPGQRILVALNFARRPARISPATLGGSSELLYSTRRSQRPEPRGGLELDPHEVCLLLGN
ncbi:MAG: alpha-glucosidase [Chloroflexi bacterium]|nr:alpha-glucosidase [Chloroflexota bacterium]